MILARFVALAENFLDEFFLQHSNLHFSDVASDHANLDFSQKAQIHLGLPLR